MNLSIFNESNEVKMNYTMTNNQIFHEKEH